MVGVGPDSLRVSKATFSLEEEESEVKNSSQHRRLNLFLEYRQCDIYRVGPIELYIDRSDFTR